MQNKAYICVVDDDYAMQDALKMILEQEGYSVRVFADGMSFLSHARKSQVDCVVLDVHMPKRSGLDILKEWNAAWPHVPVLIISGQADIPMAVQAIKDGAHDFLEKPFSGEDILTHIANALQYTERTESNAVSGVGGAFPGEALLTNREKEIAKLVASGSSNKEAARVLNISPRTVEVHRAHIMEKLGAKNVAELVRILLTVA